MRKAQIIRLQWLSICSDPCPKLLTSQLFSHYRRRIPPEGTATCAHWRTSPRKETWNWHENHKHETGETTHSQHFTADSQIWRIWHKYKANSFWFAFQFHCKSLSVSLFFCLCTSNQKSKQVLCWDGVEQWLLSLILCWGSVYKTTLRPCIDGTWHQDTKSAITKVLLLAMIDDIRWQICSMKLWR